MNNFFVQDKTKVNAMIIKLQRWALKEEQCSFDEFPVLHDFLETNEVNIDNVRAKTIRDRLFILQTQVIINYLIFFNNIDIFY